MSQFQLNVRWELSSGIWQLDEKVGFKFLGRSMKDLSRNLDPLLCQQFFNLPFLNAKKKVFPPEFQYDPDSGEKLEIESLNKQCYWLAPCGYNLNAHEDGLISSSNGLQLSEQLRQLKQAPKSISDIAEVQVLLPQAGLFEFFSIKASTPFPQLIALNKANGSLYLYNEHRGDWLELVAKGLRMAACPPALLEHWQMVGFEPQADLHEVYFPTVHGLARLVVDAINLNYTVSYLDIKGTCLSPPVFWQKHLLVIMLVDDELKVVDVLSSEIFEISSPETLNTELYFEKVVYDSSCVIWVGKFGQLILNIDTEHVLSAHYDLWRGVEPDFRFGSPYLDSTGNFYQLFKVLDPTKKPWGYIQLKDLEQRLQSSSVRFTTGHEKYSFEDKIEGDIWEESIHSVENKKIIVPMIEDKKKNLVLGFKFDSDTNLGIEDNLENKSMQDIILFIDSYDKFQEIHRVRVKAPLKSRFFYHKNHVYFYNPSLKELFGWEVEA